jgi:hypothetical protein
MVSPRVREALKVAAALLALAVAARAPNLVAAEASPNEELQQQLLDTIEAMAARDGPYSPAVLEPLRALIVLYQESEDDAFAAVAIERARQVLRINQGLHTLEQVPLIQQLIQIEHVRGNHSAAWDLEQELLALVRRYPEDLRTAPVLRAAADRQMEILAAFLGGERPPELYLGCYLQGSRSGAENCDSGSRRTAVRAMLADAQRSYSEAIAVMLRNELYGSDELRGLELELLRGIDLARTLYDGDRYDEGLWLAPTIAGPAWEPWRGRTAAVVELAAWDLPYFGNESRDQQQLETRPDRIANTYHRGRQSLRRLYAYGAASSGSLLSQVEALVHMADWELLYSHHGNAVDGYELARALLAKAGVAEVRIDELFLPQLPVVLPAFQPNPLARDESKKVAGHIDVAFEITKYGRGRGIEVLDSVDATGDAQDALVALIGNSRFRPRPTSGRFTGDSLVVVRYHVYGGTRR